MDTQNKAENALLDAVSAIAANKKAIVEIIGKLEQRIAESEEALAAAEKRFADSEEACAATKVLSAANIATTEKYIAVLVKDLNDFEKDLRNEELYTAVLEGKLRDIEKDLRNEELYTTVLEGKLRDSEERNYELEQALAALKEDIYYIQHFL